MGFILDGLETEAYDRTYRDRELLRRILGYFRPYTGRMVLVAAAISLNSVAGTGGPILISKGIDLLRVEQNPSADDDTAAGEWSAFARRDGVGVQLYPAVVCRACRGQRRAAIAARCVRRHDPA